MFLFTPEDQAKLIYRLGRLNVTNILRPDGGMQLGLERYVMQLFTKSD